MEIGRFILEFERENDLEFEKIEEFFVKEMLEC